VLLRFSVAFLIFTFGPGAACGLWFTRALSTSQRLIVLLGIGSAAAAVLIDLLGRLGQLALFPYCAAILCVAAIALWRPSRFDAPVRSDEWTARDLVACAVVIVLAVALGFVAFAHRLDADASHVTLYGDYDSLDLSYYAAISAEAVHTVPPLAPYYSGRELNYAYYPQLVLAMVHRFAGVPMLAIYFQYAWPAFLVLTALCGYVLVRALTSTLTATLSVVLLLGAGDFSYIAAWTLHHSNLNWDYVLWPTNFLSPTMESLLFNSWTPSLPIFLTALWGIAYSFQTRSRGWILMSALLVGVLFQFKPFAFIVLMAAAGATIVFSADGPARQRLAVLVMLSGVSALPFVYRSIRLYADRRSELRLAWFLLPQRMLIKLDLIDVFTSWSQRLSAHPMVAHVWLVTAATVVFFLGGFGIRWLGLPAVWQGLRGRAAADTTAWRLLAWTVVAGVAIPFVLVTEPYNDTLQFYQTGLYVLWIFTAVVLVRILKTRGVAAVLVIAVLIGLSLPSSLHYLARRWTDKERPALAGLTKVEMEIASYLRARDPERTVVLNDRPLEPSLMAVVSERRMVLAWGRYAVGSNERLREVDAFFGSTRTVPNLLEILRKHQVTHLIVHTDRDRVHPDVLSRLNLVMGDQAVQLYEVVPQ